jgi:transposase, IS5 family
MVRATSLVRETAKIALANLAYNTRRLVWIDGRTAPA